MHPSSDTRNNYLDEVVVDVGVNKLRLRALPVKRALFFIFLCRPLYTNIGVVANVWKG